MRPVLPVVFGRLADVQGVVGYTLQVCQHFAVQQRGIGIAQAGIQPPDMGNFPFIHAVIHLLLGDFHLLKCDSPLSDKQIIGRIDDHQHFIRQGTQLLFCRIGKIQISLQELLMIPHHIDSVIADALNIAEYMIHTGQTQGVLTAEFHSV